MHLPVIKVLLLTAVVSAFTLPDNQPDGSYIAFLNEKGEEVHLLNTPENLAIEKAASSALKAREALPGVTPRDGPTRTLTARVDNYSTWCGCGITLNSGSCDSAVEDLKSQLGGGSNIRQNTSWYSIKGGVVAFACCQTNYTSDCKASRTKVTEALETVTNATDIGYMRHSNGLNFCKNAKSSSDWRCL